MAPEVTPLLLFGGFASNSERCEGAEGNHIVGKERAGADKIHRLNADLEGSEPAPDQGHIVVLRRHDSLLGLRLVDLMLLLHEQPVNPSAVSSSMVEWAG